MAKYLAKKYWYLIIFLVTLVVGVVHGLVLEESIMIFFSWVLIGSWICYTLVFLQKLRYYREFNSPHNTSFFILTPLLIGILFSFWGYFTGLFGWNLFGDFPLYLSPWTLVLALTYLIYGVFSLYSCFRRYDVIYLGQKSISARKFGIFVILLTLIFVIFVSVSFMIFDLSLISIHFSPDLLLLLTSLFIVYLLIRYGIVYTQPTLSEISTTTARRRTRREEIGIPTSRTSPRTTSSHSSTQRQTTRSSTNSAERTRTPSSPRPAQRTAKESKTKKTERPKSRKILQDLRPKAGTLSVEDFKCIICFNLPAFPADRGRGIVLCPKCKHPAHADEFKDWTKSSTLCSRCDAKIPSSFRQNPEIIPVKDYVQVIKAYSKKMK